MSRSCTDVLFLIAFIAFWVGMVVCAGMGFSQGDPVTLFYFVDYNGNQCGQGDLADYKYTYWTHPLNQRTNVCVKECPKKYEKFTLTSNTTVGSANIGYTRSAGALTATACSGTIDVAAGTFDNYWLNCINTDSTPQQLQNKPCCAADDAPPPGGVYFCIPKMLMSAGAAAATSSAEAAASSSGNSTAGGGFAQDFINGGGQAMNAAIGDLITGWYIIVVAAVGSWLISVLWIFILQKCAACFVWIAILGSIVMALCMTAGAYFMYDKYKKDFDANGLDNDQQMMYISLAALCIFGALSFVLLCMTVCLCKQIKIAIKIIEEACMCINTMKSVTLFPLVQYLIMVVFGVYWIFVAVFMASAGEKKKDETTGVYTMVYSDDMKKAILYHFFGLLWNMAFLRHMTILILAGCFSAWYWTPAEDKEQGNYPTMPLMASVKRSVFWHSGTVAFGSFIIAVIQFIRAVLAYIKEKYLKDKPSLKCLVTYIECCMACFERLMEFISKNAYIVTASKGKMFCTAAYEAFCFILSNLGQVSVINWISAYLMGLGKGFILMGTVALCLFMATANADISSPWILIVLCAILSYLVACLFLGVFDTCIDTILVCFCWERDAKGNFKDREDGKTNLYASQGLRDFIEGANKLASDAEAKNSADASAPGGVTEVKPAAEAETPAAT